MLGFGSFGEIHLAYDNQLRCLCAIKFELATQKNPQLKHEYNILEHLNKSDGTGQGSNIIQEGVPKAYNFEQIEGKCNLMVLEFLGPSLADLFNYRKKQFSLQTVYIIGLQMIQRIEFMHEKGFIHRDIKPENFVVGLNEKSNMVYIIDFGLSRRYKDKNTGQHIPYRENRHLVGTARYASINAHLGIEQSRRDDIESIGYVLVYFALGRLPWQSKNEKGKSPAKILEKKLVTPPEVLCRKLPEQFAYYFHYCRNLKYEDRPDYGTLKALFWDLLTNNGLNISNEYMFDWYREENEEIEQNNQNDNQQVNNINLIDLTPPGKNVELKQTNSSQKKDQFTFTKTGDFNSPQKKNSKHGSEISKKNIDRDFSESGSESVASSDEEDSDRKKHQSKKCIL
jgi:casein kinase 1 epsilon